jgi:RimJ/RimL family protein N-acetyltransferase
LDETISKLNALTQSAFGQPGTWFQLAIVKLPDEALVGDIGLHFCESHMHYIEIGCTIRSTHQNQGIAFKALNLAFDFLSEYMGISEVVAKTDPQNKPAIRLLEKLGFKCETRIKNSAFMRNEWVDDLVFRKRISEHDYPELAEQV